MIMPQHKKHMKTLKQAAYIELAVGSASYNVPFDDIPEDNAYYNEIAVHNPVVS